MEHQSSQASPNLIELLRRGDPRASTLLVQRYADRLIALARQHLDKRLRGKVDPEDVQQSVFGSFFRRHAEGEWDLSDENALWPLLLRITIRKCNRCLEDFLAARRDVRREVAAVDLPPPIDPEPTPEETASFVDVMEAVMKRLRTPVKQRIFRLTLEGYSVVEISQRVEYYERGVERVRAEIRTLLQTMMVENGTMRG